jgi:AraC-like DNA-binding protein
MVLPDHTKPVVASGTATFTNPDLYQSSIGETNIELTFTAGGDFKARLTWLNLGQLRVVRGCENIPRIAYFSLRPGRAIFVFPTNSASATWNGVELRVGDVVFCGACECTHHWTTGHSEWGLVSLPFEQLAACGWALTGSEMALSPHGQALRSPHASHLIRLHSRVCRLAEVRHHLISNAEVIRSMEQELLHALVKCLTSDDTGWKEKPRSHHAEIMLRFEDALRVRRGSQLDIPDLCATLGVPERTLRMCCTDFLGVSPTRYFLLRRLNKARLALLRADRVTASVAEIARSCEFSELGRFAVTYRSVFGETPSATLRRAVT